MNLIEVAENYETIAADQNIVCPDCGQKQFSEFGKLYVSAYGTCQDHETDDDELSRKGENIFKIITAHY